MSNLCLFIFETMYCFVLLGIAITRESVSKRSCTFIAVITQIRTFSLNLGTSNKSFETTKYFLKRSVQKK